ncbi:MAG: hypothetical protein EP343_08965 [Deltaproteobacteria bacterium]|nr:MAG: hypothetical protein EP343_08965 [Deltaproteobacteria bacterium]
MKRYLLLIFVVGFSSSLWLACGNPPVESDGVGTETVAEGVSEPPADMLPDASEAPDDASTAPEATVEAEPVQESPPEVVEEPTPDAGEPVPESEPVPEPEPKTCLDGEACNALLLPDGTCPGRCFPQPDQLTCKGTVRHSLCFRNPPQQVNQPVTVSGILFEPGPIPSLVTEGETKTFTIKATNTTTKPVNLPFTYSNSFSWQLIDASFKNLTSFDFKAGEVKTLTVQVRATKVDVFSSGLSGSKIITLNFNRIGSLALSSAIGFPPDSNNITCGQHHFPTRYCPTPQCSQSRTHYTQAKCCNNVFFPGAECCSSADCQEGSCFDGICVRPTPRSLGNTLPIGNHRILVVLSDFQDIPHEPSKICTNRFKEFKSRLKVTDFEAYYDKLSQQYTGRPAQKYEWVVLAGINTQDFNPNGDKSIRGMHTALESYLVSKGCIKGASDFDKRLIISSNLDLNGFTGYAVTEGRIAMKKIDMYLFAHELMHTYGAQDLYLNMGGKLQYLFDLMGNNLGRYGVPEFGVTWGEIMWGDTNKNGVIDVFEFAVYPDSFVVIDPKAQLSAKNTIELSADIAAMEGGVQKRTLLRRWKIELPDYKASLTTVPGRTVVFGSNQVDLDDVRKKGSIKVRFEASFFFTDSQFKRKELKLSVEKVIQVSNP